MRWRIKLPDTIVVHAVTLLIEVATVCAAKLTL
jgi:hypothetical protein